MEKRIFASRVSAWGLTPDEGLHILVTNELRGTP